MSDKKVTEGELIPALGNVVKQKITRPKELFLLFWVDELINDEYDSGLNWFKSSANTRVNNIKASAWYDKNIHIVHSSKIEEFYQIKEIIDSEIMKNGGKKKGKVKEIVIFSHCGWDGPIIYSGRGIYTNQIPNDILNNKMQMSLSGWNNICSNWAKDAICVFYGCNSANETKYGENKSFAKNISLQTNFVRYNVKVIGQTDYSYPSSLPDYRIISISRVAGFNWDDSFCYMVGGKKDRVFRNMSWVNDVSDKYKPIYDPVEPMNFYQNGIKVYSGHQGVFNDHQKNAKN